MNLNKMMDQGIAQIMTTAGRFYLNNSKGRAFLMGVLPELAKSSARRKQQEKEGLHVPPFLIASIASQCNLHCAGCYARAGGGCGPTSGKTDMDAGQWGNVFDQAARLGDAEPCPFSPHAKQNLTSDSVEAVLRSQYFADLREIAVKAGNHGGCTLFEVNDQVEKLLA